MGLIGQEYISSVVLLQLEKLYYERYKKIIIIIIICLFYNQYAIFMALNFHSTQQVSKNSLVHALIKQLKYLQMQNRCFHNWKVHLRIHCNIAICFFLFFQVVNAAEYPHPCIMYVEFLM